MRFHDSVIVAIFIAVVTVVGAVPASETEFDALVDLYWNWRLQDVPEFATSIDVHTYDGRTELFGIDVMAERYANVSNFLKDLSHIHRDLLSEETKLSYDVLKDTLEIYIAGYRWKDYGPMNPVNFLEGVWADSSYLIPKNPQTYADFYNYGTRLYGLSEQALDFVKRMRRAMSQNTTNHWVSMAAVAHEIDGLLGASEVDNEMYAPFNETMDNTTLSDKEKTELRSLAVTTMHVFRTNYEALKNFTNTEYKVATRQSYGVSSFKDGQEYYKACMKWHLSVDMTPQEVHDLGLQEVQRIATEMHTVMNNLNFQGSIREFYEALNKNQSFIMNSTEEILQRYQHIINVRVSPKLAKLFKNIPDRHAIVKPLPYDGPGGMYMAGSEDGSRPGIFYVNVFRPADNPTYFMPALTLHEVDPGHHLQDVFSQAATGVRAFQKVADYSKSFSAPLHFPTYTAYVEGWGLYAESLGEKEYLDIYQDDYEMMGRYSMEMFRACRLVVDTGLHYFNWERDRAIQYMANYLSLSIPSITIEVDRYITWPGQALAYKIGEIKIKELRNKSMDELGPLFDIKDFHAVVLGSGAVPLSLLERQVDDWIKDVKEKDSFEKLGSDFWAWRMGNSKEFSTLIGKYRYNDKLDSYSYEKLDENKVSADGFLLRLSWIDATKMSSEKKIAYDVLKNILETFVAGYKWKDYTPLSPVNFLELWGASLSAFLDNGPMDTEGDFVNYVRRIEHIPQQLDEMIALSRRAIQNGHTSHNASVSRVPGNIDSYVTVNPEDSELFKPFIDFNGTFFTDETQRDEMYARITAAITNANNKFLELKTFIVKEYMPNTRPGFGVGSLPNGQQLYKDCLYYHTSTEITAEEVHQLGLKEVDRIATEMRKKMDNLGYPSTMTIPEMFQKLTTDKRFLLDTPEESLARFKEIVSDRIEPLIPQYFNHAPSLPLEIRASASDGVGGEYRAGTEDGSKPGIFYVNVHKPEYNPTFKMVALTLHEAVPGHHLAESYGMTADIPAYMKNFEWISYNAPYFFPFFNSFSEGWALYSEFLGEEMGVYQDDYEMIGRYAEEMLRAVRLVVDTGIHHYGWDRQRAIDYMLNYTAETPDSAPIEIDRYSTWPGQACGYKIGEIKIKELRKRATDQLGAKFDLAEFHYTVLRNGALPLSVLENVINEWIASKSMGITPNPPARDTNINDGSSTRAEPVYLSVLAYLGVLVRKMFA